MNLGGADAAERIMAVCRKQTTQLSHQRLDLPAAPPHMLPPNLWMANAPGSTLFMPVGDSSEQVLGLMAMVLANGAVIVDDEAGRPAGDLASFIRSGLLDDSKLMPLSVLQQSAYEANCSELDFMAHNIVLTMQAMGLGGLYLSGLNRWSILGAFADEGVAGLGFRFVRDERWTLPDPVGLDSVYETLCPPYYPDMRAAVEGFVARKFGPGGAYDPTTPGPWRDAAEIKRGVTPYSEEFVACPARSPSTSTTPVAASPPRSRQSSYRDSCRPSTSTPTTTTPTTRPGRTCRPTPRTGSDGTPGTPADLSATQRYAAAVTRVDDRLMTAVDALVAEGVFGSRSEVVREGLRTMVDRHRRAQVAAEIIEAYQARPQTDEEYSWSDDATRDLIADEPW